MTINTTQKVIKVGDSLAVTIPAKEAKEIGIKVGSRLKFSAELVEDQDKQADLMSDYKAFVSQYGQTLKNLKDR
ncbi:MAG: AbrB/MazE/SpoVT family DNA-binding domain-containing protein [bacterium]|nr:AbrB/MazE/SpoVT family DNA-binding domain-containing protein [bacterium]